MLLDCKINCVISTCFSIMAVYFEESIEVSLITIIRDVCANLTTFAYTYTWKKLFDQIVNNYICSGGFNMSQFVETKRLNL